jgi:hypothetical protein
MKQLIFAAAFLSASAAFAQTNVFPQTGNVGIGTTNPQASLEIAANENCPIIKGNGGYIPTGLRFIDDSYTQPGEVKEWSIWKGNAWLKGLAFMRYDAVNPCNTGICDVALFLGDNGNIGINKSDPQFKLDVNGNSNINGNLNILGAGKIIGWDDPDNYFLGHYPVTSSSGLNIHWYGGIKFGTAYGDVMQILETGNVGIGTATPTEKLEINGNQKVSGKVGIGGVTSFPTTAGGVNVSGYNLFVKGGILSDEIRVALNTTWADYVFADDYNLKPLSEVETFIAQNKHLPNVPSAAQVKEEGLNVGEISRIQQEKIEELTLYIIQQEKRLKALEAKLDNK